MTLALYLRHASEPSLAAWARRPHALLSVAGGRQPVLTSRRSPPADVLGLRHSWHVLHGLFTGSPWEGPAPANTLMSGGRETGVDLGCGKPRLISAEQTRAFSWFVEPLCPYQLRTRIDARRVARTRFYAAEHGACPDVEDLREIVVRDLPKLKAYLGQATAHGDGMLAWMM